ncbi:hypothetical protein ZWY2020_026215 [Hordeum vulgare]|nr:hypothetical protein ZWY2020_026215 [Hordeum vulgare]
MRSRYHRYYLKRRAHCCIFISIFLEFPGSQQRRHQLVRKFSFRRIGREVRVKSFSIPSRDYVSHVRLEEESRLRQEAQANALLQQEQGMKMQQTLIQQQEFMAKQQAALQETFARFSNIMQCSTLPDLPPVPPLPTFSLIVKYLSGSLGRSLKFGVGLDLAAVLVLLAVDNTRFSAKDRTAGSAKLWLRVCICEV